MPIYEFRCRKCQTQFEAIRPVGDDGKKVNCPECGEKRPRKLPAVFAASTSRGSSGAGGPTSFG